MAWTGAWALLLLDGCSAHPRQIASDSARARSPVLQAPNDASGHVRYCTTTADEQFVPKCIGELSIEQAKRRAELLRLVEADGRLVRVERINSSLKPLGETPEVTATELLYQDGKVVELVGLDRNNVVRTRKRLVKGGIRWLDSIGRPRPEDESPVSGAELRLDERGRVVDRRFVDARGDAATRTDGVSTVRYRYGPLGLVEDESYFDRDGSPQTNSKGVHRIARAYGADGLERELRFLDVTGAPAARTDGVQSIVTSFDENGNSLESSDFDADGNPHQSSEDGAAVWRVRRDELGRQSELAFFDTQGLPVVSAYGYFLRRITWNDAGLATSWSFFDSEGNPARIRGTEHARQTRLLDSRDRPIRKAWFNPDGSPNTKYGAAIELYFYDDRDNLVLRRSLTETGAPTRAEDGHYSILRQTFDVDRLQREEHLDETGQLYAIKGSVGFAYTYDELGTRTKLRLDEHGQPDQQIPP